MLNPYYNEDGTISKMAKLHAYPAGVTIHVNDNNFCDGTAAARPWNQIDDTLRIAVAPRTDGLAATSSDEWWIN